MALSHATMMRTYAGRPWAPVLALLERRPLAVVARMLGRNEPALRGAMKRRGVRPHQGLYTLHAAAKMTRWDWFTLRNAARAQGCGFADGARYYLSEDEVLALSHYLAETSPKRLERSAETRARLSAANRTRHARHPTRSALYPGDIVACSRVVGLCLRPRAHYELECMRTGVRRFVRASAGAGTPRACRSCSMRAMRTAQAAQTQAR